MKGTNFGKHSVLTNDRYFCHLDNTYSFENCGSCYTVTSLWHPGKDFPSSCSLRDHNLKRRLHIRKGKNMFTFLFLFFCFSVDSQK